MTSTELKHQARQQKWVAAIQNCRSSGLPVRQWCKQRGITPSTYYRWEREVLSIADAAPEFPGTCVCRVTSTETAGSERFRMFRHAADRQ